MRLTKIKLAGFKSFVDPTAVGFPGNLTGVVGPNGCGKSNIIDAVRWVMGELSAKHLRGDSMADVIFNGSATRKPVGAASVELIFDNSDGKIGGPYASYSEVSLKRVVSRDGQSQYLINGARCRRKDITQLFLGTGLGSRSYAIIEQGMISRVIEAKADDMRAFVEEAAGISRYKERRRETEARISDTRENLDRLNDVRGEIDKQIRHLQRQAGAARRYQSFKADERRLWAQLLAFKLRELDNGVVLHDDTMRERELAMQAVLAEQRSSEAAIATQRSFHDELSEQISAVQGRYYEAGAQVSRLEQQIQFTREKREQQRVELARLQQQTVEVEAHLQRDAGELEKIRSEKATLAPDHERAVMAQTAARGAHDDAEVAVQAWQQRWEDFNRELGGAQQAVQVEAARIEQLEAQLRRLQAHKDRIAIEREKLVSPQDAEQLRRFDLEESESRDLIAANNAELDRGFSLMQAQRGAIESTEAQLETARKNREALQAEIVAREALQRASQRSAVPPSAELLTDLGLDRRTRLAGSLQVASGWERAVETVLGDWLEAICIDASDDLTNIVERLASTSTFLAVRDVGRDIRPQLDSLAQHVSGAAAAEPWLAAVRIAPSVTAALARRSQLGPGESLVTRDGVWVGPNWIRIPANEEAHSGAISREKELRQLRVDLRGAMDTVGELESRLATQREQYASADATRQQSMLALAQLQQSHTALVGRHAALKAVSEEAAARLQKISDEAQLVEQEFADASQALRIARQRHDAARGETTTLDARQPELQAERDHLRERLVEMRNQLDHAQLQVRELAVRMDSRNAAEDTLAANLQRQQAQLATARQQIAQLGQDLEDDANPVPGLERELAGRLDARLELEGELAERRRALEEAEAQLRALDERRQTAEQAVGLAREAMEAARLAAQETRVRREGLAEQFAQTDQDLGEVMAGLPADFELQHYESELAQVREAIEKLGQVNLAAIDELKEHSERKEYLDRQHADLTAALETLQQAMRKIEKETRARFSDTFDRINAGLKEKFPRLFGGGHAYLELSGEDDLTAGVTVMARPPGKRNSTISQLSGGEKALTAVALVFAIFELNPAPFCLLDEVDAPLDEHNVGRFCDIVREMSQHVQFIFITHNKATMELAGQLLGVTMHEAGVSRLVSVDVDEAVRMAAV
ncbi:MAG: chromosome segregation protein SMC [Steroidobacteraceae bacterium]